MRLQFLVVILMLITFAGTDLLAKGKKKDSVETSSGDSNLSYIQGRQKVLEGKLDEAIPLLENALKSDENNAFMNYQLGEIYFRLSNLDKAEMFSRKSVDLEPGNLNYRANLGAIYASQRRYAEAKEQYQKILELDPTNSKAPMLLAVLEAESGKEDDGIAVLTKHLEGNPENVMALFYRAKIYLQKDDIENAKADLAKCLSLRPSFIDAGTALGLLHEKQGEVDEAIKTYSEIQGTGPFNKRLAQLYLQKNEFDKALRELLEYIKYQPDDYTVRVKIGLLYFEMKKYDLAIENFKVIIKEQPQADNVRFYLAAVYEEQKAYDKAIAEFKKVTKDSSFFREAMLHIGFIYRERNKLKEGLEFAKGISKKNLDIVEFYDMQAAFHEMLKEYDSALKALAKGLEKFPKDEKLLYFQGAVYDKVGKKDQAVTNMKTILTINDNNPHALNFLAYSYAETGKNLDEAEAMVNKALTARPDDGFILDSLGWVLFKKGKVDDAIEKLERAATLQKDEPVILDHLGDAYAQKKEMPRALEYYRQAIKASESKDKTMGAKIKDKLAKLGTDERVPTNE